MTQPIIRRRRDVPLAACVTLALAACVRYEPAPLDGPRHAADFLSRSADSPAIRALHESAAASGEQAGAFDLADGLSAREAEVVALIHNPSLRIARSRLGVTMATRDNAGRWDDPVLSADVVRYFESTINPWEYAIGIGLTLPISGRLAAERERAGAAHEAELLRVAESEWSTRLDLRETWIRWSALRERIALLDQVLGDVGEITADADRLEAAGELARIEARLFRLEASARRAERLAAVADEREAALQLERLMGLPPAARVSPIPSLVPPALPRDGITTERLLRCDPALAVARAEYEVAERTLAREIRGQYPDLMIGPAGGEDQGVPTAILGVSLPIPLWNRNAQGVGEAHAERDLARVVFETTLERRLADLASAEAALEGARSHRAHVEGELVPLTAEEAADARRLSKLGEMNVVVLLDAVTRQLDARLRLLDAREREALATVALVRILGPDSPSEPHP